MKKIFLLIIILVVLITAILFFNFSKQETIQLDETEIKEYQGEKLDSVNDFRENSIKGVQYIDIENYSLKITGLVEQEKELNYEEVITHQDYSKIITLHCVEGWDATILWQGVLVKDLLDEVEISENVNIVIFHAYDGYTTSFPLEYFYDKDIILAYKMNNETIIPARGFPFQLVAEDKWGYKWIKWITEIELSDNEDYEGYWESRGYSNTGNLKEGFF